MQKSASSFDFLTFFNHPAINLPHYDEIVVFMKSFCEPSKVWSIQQFMMQLDQLYDLTRIRFTKGGHKTNQDNKTRQSFICQCHGRGAHARQA